jgi:ABC-type nitrate/sulfonate/bicarbonate transport system ATPase subunit
VITLRDVSVSLGNDVILRDVTLDVERHNILAIMGPSGSGKTTLLRAIAGFVNCASGDLTIDGRSAQDYRVRRQIAIVFQRYSNITWLDAHANVHAALSHIKEENVRHAMSDAYLTDVGLAQVAGRYMRELSGGMQQRVALARAIAQPSELLLLDEPFASLDFITRRNILEMLGHLLERHPRTVVLVTHAVEDVVRFADRVVVLGGKPCTILASLDLPGRHELVSDSKRAELAVQVERMLLEGPAI